VILSADKFKFRSGELHFTFTGFNELSIDLVNCHWRLIPGIVGTLRLERHGQKTWDCHSLGGASFLHRLTDNKIPVKTQTAIIDAILRRINTILIHEKDFEAQCIRAERRVLSKRTEVLTAALQDARVKVNQTGHELEEARTALRNWEARFKGIL